MHRRADNECQMMIIILANNKKADIMFTHLIIRFLEIILTAIYTSVA